jgi:N-acyl-D-aspartate/D-glutamate deacylase
MRPLALLCLAVLPAAIAQDFDLVVRNGRVLDPESKLDGVRNVGIRGGRVRAVTAAQLRGRTEVDATGLVVAPGFIDLHSHGQDDENYRAKAMDGVTTALELEVGAADIKRWYGERAGKARIHYGAAVGHIPARMTVMHDPGSFLPTGDGAHRAATPGEITGMRLLLEAGLRDGAMGVGFGLGYTVAASRWEVLEMFRLAARVGATCFVHLRGTGEDSVEALEEVIAASAITGAPLHVVHLTSMGLGSTAKLLDKIAEARKR